eukprot:Skav230274  [mRNA]  locus=scaffold3387:531388:532452:- [translate_table: standard]
MGRCRSTRGMITSGYLGGSGYCRIRIAGGDFQVHRLVAWAFLGPPPNEAAWRVNHVDGNKSNNLCSNLAWVTQSENIQHSFFALGRQCSASGKSRPVSINGTHYPSISEAARGRGEAESTLRRRCHRNATVNGCEYRFCSCDGNLPGEEWKPMINPRTGKEVPGRLVSSCGRITSRCGIRSCGCQKEEGYLRTDISQRPRIHRQKEHAYIHRLVARAFLPWPPPSPEHTQVNHKDLNNSNNAVENLEWVTPAENNAHKIANQKGPLSNWKPVLSRAHRSDDKWRHHPSTTKAAEELGLRQNLVSNCARGEQKQTGGYEFRFVETEEDQNQDLPGELWRDVDVEAHLRERKTRQQ